jgi:uncharacterized membrane protein
LTLDLGPPSAATVGIAAAMAALAVGIVRDDSSSGVAIAHRATAAGAVGSQDTKSEPPTAM